MICIWEEAGDSGTFKDSCGFEINDKSAVAINIGFDAIISNDINE